tara:strand:+ start:375 stop:749 length:375 start_codon:yes stop_codon:yes gene_type:complete
VVVRGGVPWAGHSPLVVLGIVKAHLVGAEALAGFLLAALDYVAPLDKIGDHAVKPLARARPAFGKLRLRQSKPAPAMVLATDVCEQAEVLHGKPQIVRGTAGDPAHAGVGKSVAAPFPGLLGHD